jgi:hypothetical protein
MAIGVPTLLVSRTWGVITELISILVILDWVGCGRVFERGGKEKRRRWMAVGKNKSEEKRERRKCSGYL